ncbi:MAG: hypothetical protein HWD86_08585 [Kangiellaceae bacterium]|nr:hypothetical protein [Kangiellaceae bacterium]
MIEKINKIEILDSGELYLCLVSGERASYQHIYRDGREVYWDNDKQGFKSPKPRKWSYFDWYKHICLVVSQSMNLTLELAKTVEWKNISSELQLKIINHDQSAHH